jgi:hypothetical protein
MRLSLKSCSIFVIDEQRMGHFTVKSANCPVIVRDLIIRITYLASLQANSLNFRHLAAHLRRFKAIDAQEDTWLDKRRCYARWA